MIDSVLLAQDRCRLAHHSRVDAIELNGPDIFTLGKGKHAVGLVVPVNQATRRDHFADIQARTLFGTKLAECGIGNAGHGASTTGVSTETVPPEGAIKVRGSENTSPW